MGSCYRVIVAWMTTLIALSTTTSRYEMFLTYPPLPRFALILKPCPTVFNLMSSMRTFSTPPDISDPMQIPAQHGEFTVRFRIKIFLQGIATSKPKQSQPLFIATPSSQPKIRVHQGHIEESGSKPSVFSESDEFSIVNIRATTLDEYVRWIVQNGLFLNLCLLLKCHLYTTFQTNALECISPGPLCAASTNLPHFHRQSQDHGR